MIYVLCLDEKYYRPHAFLGDDFQTERPRVHLGESSPVTRCSNMPEYPFYLRDRNQALPSGFATYKNDMLC